jgi:hypothetical protein
MVEACSCRRRRSTHGPVNSWNRRAFPPKRSLAPRKTRRRRTTCLSGHSRPKLRPKGIRVPHPSRFCSGGVVRLSLCIRARPWSCRKGCKKPGLQPRHRVPHPSRFCSGGVVRLLLLYQGTTSVVPNGRKMIRTSAPAPGAHPSRFCSGGVVRLSLCIRARPWSCHKGCKKPWGFSPCHRRSDCVLKGHEFTRAGTGDKYCWALAPVAPSASCLARRR